MESLKIVRFKDSRNFGVENIVLSFARSLEARTKTKAQKFSRKLCGAAEEFLDLCHSNIVDPRIFYEGPVNVGILLNTFFSRSWEDMTWPELEWFTTKL